MRISILLFLTILIISCDDDKTDDECVTKATIDDVVWTIALKESMTDCHCETSIIKGKYNNQTVIFISLTDPRCNGINTPTLYSCQGEEIKSFTTSAVDQKELFDKVTIDSVLYRCSQ